MPTDTPPNKPSVLFVCLGNICRSPTAEAVFRARSQSAGLSLHIDSAGTSGWHTNEAPDKRSMEHGLRRGYSFDGQASRQVESLDFVTFDYIIAMDVKNLKALSKNKPQNFTGHLGLFLDFAKGYEGKPVPDPYYGGDTGFENVLDLVEMASDGLIAHINSSQ